MEINKTDPEDFGLNKRTVLHRINKNHVAIVKLRKSRIIMKDGEAVLSQAEVIRNASKNIKVSLLTNAPVCSKTAAFLKSNKIDVIEAQV